MIYIHFCNNCKKIYQLNGHKFSCPKCDCKMRELDIPYTRYLSLSVQERNSYINEIYDASEQDK